MYIYILSAIKKQPNQFFVFLVVCNNIIISIRQEYLKPCNYVQIISIWNF